MDDGKRLALKSVGGVAAYEMMDDHQRDPTVKWMLVSGLSKQR